MGTIYPVLEPLCQLPRIIPCRYAEGSMLAAVHALRAAHAAYYELLAPVAVDPSLEPPEDACVVLNAAMDAGEVPGTTGACVHMCTCIYVYVDVCWFRL